MRVLRKLIRFIAMIINTMVVIWLFICSYASIKDPNGAASLWSLWSFTTFFAWIANLLFVFYWLVISRKKWRLIYSFLALVLTYQTWQPIMAWNYFGSNNTTSTETGIKIMSWNVHMFDLGEWTEDETSQTKILQFIEEEDPDVLVLQEFYWDSKISSIPYTEIIQQQGYPHVHFCTETSFPKRRLNISATQKEMINVGMVVFSKFPLVNGENFDLSDGRSKLLYTQVVIDSLHSIDLASVHLTSTGIKEDDIEFIEEIKHNPQHNEEQKSKSKHVARKLMNATAERAVLANEIAEIISLFENPTILVGDFNDIPSSYVYRKIRGPLGDAFAEKGAGLGRTFEKIFPTLRIDYILFDSQNLKVEGYYKENIGYSDHYPISANFTFLE